MNQQPFPNVLSIAGSDPCAGAGIQADIKTISALGGYACTTITAVTVQNTQGVQQAYPIAGNIIKQQCQAIFEDIEIHAVKIGMVPNLEAFQSIIHILRQYRPPFIVWDTVQASSSGYALMTTDQSYLQQLLPLVHLITPNLPELANLSGHHSIALTLDTINEQCLPLFAQGAKAILVKGGHAQGEYAEDYLLTPEHTYTFREPRLHTHNTHGTGCTLSSAIACLYPRSHDLPHSINQAKHYLQTALKRAIHWQIGQGHGSLGHFNPQD